MTERTLASNLPCRWRNWGEEDLEDLELDIDALRHAVIHRLDGGRDGTEGEGGDGDEALELAEGDDRCGFGVIHHKTHGHETKEVFRVPDCTV